MANILGDYVHLHAERYEKYGTALKEQPFDKIDAYRKYVQKRVSKINPISSEAIGILEQRLSKDSIIQNQKDKKELEQDFQKKINSLFEYIAPYTTKKILGRYQGNASDKGGWAYSGDYEKLKKMTLSEGAINQKRNIVNEINKLLDKIQIEGAQGKASEKDIKNISLLYKKLTGKRSSLGEIQEDIDNYIYYLWFSTFAGDFGEMIVAAADDNIINKAYTSLEEVLQRIKGKERTLITLDKQKVAKNLSNYITTDKAGTKYIFGSSPDKVDVDIEVNRENILASVKNYYDTSRATIQNDTSLFFALVKMSEEGNYANHWLNCHAGRLINSGTGKIANETLRFELAYEGLVGGNPLKQGTKQANVFVLMNRATGKVLVRSTKDILLHDLNLIHITPNIENIKLKNTKSKTYKDRILHLIMQTHHINFKVAYINSGH